jgi:hypothetical protein
MRDFESPLTPSVSRSSSLLLRATLVLALPGLMLTDTAHAGFIGASASSSVTLLGDGNFAYQYTITNTSEAGEPNLSAWVLPFFDDEATTFVEDSIFAPAGWTWLFTAVSGPGDLSDWEYLATDDPKNATYGAPGSAFENPPYALVFLPDLVGILLGEVDYNPIAPETSLSGFGYVSPFGGTNAPFIAVYEDGQLTIGDPAIPQTPSFPSAQSIPEPTSLVLCGLGAIGALVIGRRRRRSMALVV